VTLFLKLLFDPTILWFRLLLDDHEAINLSLRALPASAALYVNLPLKLLASVVRIRLTDNSLIEGLVYPRDQ
jgi:hypothetical protein